MRRIVLDTETTGLDFETGDRIIEIAGIELNDRTPTGKVFHEYINPERKVGREALQIHGINNDFLQDKPTFSKVAPELFAFLENANLVIHNAPFDLGFLNGEFKRVDKSYAKLEAVCEIEDTLELARSIRPSRRNSLEALAEEFNIDTSNRVYHGAKLDAEILVQVYRALTGGQRSIVFTDTAASSDKKLTANEAPTRDFKLVVLNANEEETALHEQWLDYLGEESANGCIWRELDL